MVAESAVKRGRDAVGAEPHTEQAGEAKKKGGGVVSKRWTPEQDEALKKAVAELGHRNWMAVAERVPGRDNAQCLQRWNKVLKPGLVKGPWSVEEDALLMEMMLKGYDNWRQVSNSIPGRTAKQCRERWRNRLDPSINKSPFTEEEDEAIQQAYEKYGNRWTQIAELLPGRTEDAVKLRWKALNPNQKTYTKLGRPRLLNTDDAPPVSTSPVRPQMPYASAAQPVKMDMPHQPISVSNSAMGTNQVTLEPILTPLEDDADERMSQEDVMILNEFLRGHSNNSLGNGSFKSMLSATSLRDLGDDIDAAILRMESQSHSESGTGSSKLLSLGRPPHKMLNKMLSLGDTKSASLRSITADVEPDDSWINGGLTRRLSSLSVNGGDGIFEQQLVDNNQKLNSMDSFEQQLASLNDAGSLMSLPLDLGDEGKTDSAVAAAAYDAVNGAGATGASTTTTPHDSLQQLILEDEIPVHGLSNQTATTTDTSTMTAQDFYSSTVPHDQLSTAHRFEI
ncbi:Transcription factor MYB3R-2 [Phytophthora citrophthora]|uniref:Transcription factor MYB3R-2 n=1 Tax=Phytophthora citrophthora TaxID=4793 RepID=A0AAD9LBZ8_9STRA|nr:Transcription factor MYB3R-2 [Phytophthora citrophthora]